MERVIAQKIVRNNKLLFSTKGEQTVAHVIHGLFSFNKDLLEHRHAYLFIC